MEIINFSQPRIERHAGFKAKKGDEQIVKDALIKSWTKMLERYTVPGAPVPAVNDIYGELLHQGVEAGVKAVCKAHWFVFPDMVRGKIEKKVKEGLSRCDLEEFRRDVIAAQGDPHAIDMLKDRIRHYVSL